MPAEQKRLSAACKCICLNITSRFMFISASSTRQTLLTRCPPHPQTHTYTQHSWKFQSRNQAAFLSSNLWDFGGIKHTFSTDWLTTAVKLKLETAPPPPSRLVYTHTLQTQNAISMATTLSLDWVAGADFPGLSCQQQEIQFPSLYSHFLSWRRRHVPI